MKIPTPLLLASLALNVALLGVVAFGARSTEKARPAATPPSQPAPTAPATRELTAATWSELQAGDLAAERDRLRAEGFPPSLIRAILAAQIRESFAARRKAIENSSADAPFWKNTPQSPETRAALRQLAQDERKALNDLLGPDTDNGTVANLRRTLPNLSPDKLEQLAAITDRYNEQRSDIYGGGPPTAADREKLRALEKAMHDEFATVLSPDELTNFDLRNSPTARNLQWRLRDFDPSEQEYQALYQLQSAFDEQYGNGPIAPDQRRARAEAQKQLDQQLAATLGPERYADYQRATDYNYQQTTQLVARLGLASDVANQVYALQKDVQARASSIRRGSTSAQDLNDQLAALATETQTKITGMLGTTGYDAYKRYGGLWLANIAPRPAPRPRAPSP